MPTGDHRHIELGSNHRLRSNEESGEHRVRPSEHGRRLTSDSSASDMPSPLQGRHTPERTVGFRDTGRSSAVDSPVRGSETGPYSQSCHDVVSSAYILKSSHHTPERVAERLSAGSQCSPPGGRGSLFHSYGLLIPGRHTSEKNIDKSGGVLTHTLPVSTTSGQRLGRHTPDRTVAFRTIHSSDNMAPAIPPRPTGRYTPERCADWSSEEDFHVKPFESSPSRRIISTQKADAVRTAEVQRSRSTDYYAGKSEVVHQRSQSLSRVQDREQDIKDDFMSKISAVLGEFYGREEIEMNSDDADLLNCLETVPSEQFDVYPHTASPEKRSRRSSTHRSMPDLTLGKLRPAQKAMTTRASVNMSKERLDEMQPKMVSGSTDELDISEYSHRANASLHTSESRHETSVQNSFDEANPTQDASGFAAENDHQATIKRQPVTRAKSDLHYRCSPHPHHQDSSDLSNLSARVSRTGNEIERFFTEMGIERNVLYDNQATSRNSVFFDSVSSVDSNNPQNLFQIQQQNETSQQTGLKQSDLASHGRTETSIVEKNARIIKWLITCRKAQGIAQKASLQA